MSDILEATQTDWKETIDGKEVVIQTLNIYDRADLLRPTYEARQREWEARREKRVANLKAAGITGTDMYNQLEDYDDSPVPKPSEQDWIDLVNNPDTDVAIYMAALKKTLSADEAEKIARKLAPNLTRKATLCGLSVGKKETSGSDADPNAIPPTYQSDTTAPTT